MLRSLSDIRDQSLNNDKIYNRNHVCNRNHFPLVKVRLFGDTVANLGPIAYMLE